MPGEVTVEELQAQLAEKDARISALNAESAKHRLGKNDAATQLEATTGERDALRAQLEAARPATGRVTELERLLSEAATARTAAETEAATHREAVKKVTTTASLKVAAVQAGLVDLDALALVKTEGLELNDVGELKDPAKVMADLKAAKPYLFGASGTTTTGTSHTGTKPPPPANATKKSDVLAMSEADFDAAVKSGAWRK
jgi:hypothetical protein